jgi:hypothetical protein
MSVVSDSDDDPNDINDLCDRNPQLPQPSPPPAIPTLVPAQTLDSTLPLNPPPAATAAPAGTNTNTTNNTTPTTATTNTTSTTATSSSSSSSSESSESSRFARQLHNVAAMTGGGCLDPDEWANLLTMSNTVPPRVSADWESAEVVSVASRPDATRNALAHLVIASSVDGFFGPMPCEEGDGSVAGQVIKLLPSCTAVPFDERGDAKPTKDPNRTYPTGVKLLPLLLRSQLRDSKMVALRAFTTAVEQGTFMNRAPDKTSVQWLIYKVVSLHSLCACVCVCVCA